MNELRYAEVQLEEVIERVKAVIRKIVEVLEHDIPIYVISAVREVFAQELEHVQRMSKEDVINLKKDTRAVAEEAKTKIVEELLATDEWFVKEPVAGYRDSIFQNGNISAIIKRVEGYIHDLLAKYRFPAELKYGQRAPYDVTPYDITVFYSEGALRKLSKEYWVEVAEYYKLKHQVDKLKEDERREIARKIWDEAEEDE